MSGCSLLPGIFGILVQIALFVLVVLVLVLKKKLEDRQRSSPRSWPIFCLDCSKQLIGAGWVHILNMACSALLGESQAKIHTDMGSCEWYWINIVVDTTLGVYIEYLLLKGITRCAERALGNEHGDFRSGSYLSPSGAFQLARYAKQLAVWLAVVSSMKVIMLILLLTLRRPLQGITKFILRPVLDRPMAELIVVMIVTPFFMNALQCWITDNFIKDKRGEQQDVASSDLPSSHTWNGRTVNGGLQQELVTSWSAGPAKAEPQPP